MNTKAYFGKYGGQFVPETAMNALIELEKAYERIATTAEFRAELDDLLAHYVGRPSPLYYASRLSEHYGHDIYLKREDLNHTGAHKINNALAQALLAKKMGKKKVLAETGAGQHGVATATAVPAAWRSFGSIGRFGSTGRFIVAATAGSSSTAFAWLRTVASAL